MGRGKRALPKSRWPMTTATTGAVVVLAVGIYAGANTSDRPGVPNPTSTDSQPSSPGQTAAAHTPSPGVTPPPTVAAQGLAPPVENVADVAPHNKR
jgi:hypothetical protein